MPSTYLRLKYLECVYATYLCVNLSQESLDKTRAKYKKKVENHKKLLIEVITRILRNKKILTQAKECAAKKAKYLANKLDAKGKDVQAKEISCPTIDTQFAFSPIIQSTLRYINKFIKFRTSKVASSSLSGASLVPRCFLNQGILTILQGICCLIVLIILEYFLNFPFIITISLVIEVFLDQCFSVSRF